MSIVFILQLNDNYQFPYFTRTVPSDNYQAHAIVDIMSRYGWTYITILLSLGSYGERGREVNTKNTINNDNNNIVIDILI